MGDVPRSFPHETSNARFFSGEWFTMETDLKLGNWEVRTISHQHIFVEIFQHKNESLNCGRLLYQRSRCYDPPAVVHFISKILCFYYLH